MFLEKAKSRQFWDSVRTNPKYQPIIDELLQEYQLVAQGEIKDISYDAFMHYHRTGERTLFERQYYMPRRQRLNVCALLSLIYPENDAYFSNLMNTIWAICNEYAWSLPNHNAKVSAHQYNVTHIDLFAAETAQALSEIRFLLGDRMDDLMNDRIQKELDRRIIQPFVNTVYDWEDYQTNWAAVCGGGVGCTFLYERPDLFWQLKPRFDHAMESFLSSYKADGVSREGVLYWQYGFGYFTCYAQHLYEVSKGAYNYFADEHVKAMAHFPEMTLLGHGEVVNFSDCGRKAKVGLGTLSILDQHYGDILCHIPEEYYMIMDYLKRGRWQVAVRGVVYFDPERNYASPIKSGIYYKEDSAWFVKKSPAYCFAAKGGHNDEPHNHNDVGSFLLSCNGKQILADLGSGEYTKDYFWNRYAVFCTRSLGHNVPILDGQEQGAGETYAGTMTWNGDHLVIDMTHAYPKNRVLQAVRTFAFAEDAFVLKDTFSFTEPCGITERLISLVKPELSHGQILVSAFAVCFDSNAWEASVTETTHKRYDSQEETVYLIDFVNKDPDAAEFTARIAPTEKENACENN